LRPCVPSVLPDRGSFVSSTHSTQANHLSLLHHSGKHGKFNGTSDGEISTFGYSDAYVRFFPESHSLLGRSIVIHSSNKTRLACGNITSFLDGTADYSFEPTHKPSKYVKHYPTAAPVQPTPPVIPFNGTVMTGAYLFSF
jgi:hypothetical protein